MWILGLKELSNNVSFGYLNPSCDKMAHSHIQSGLDCRDIVVFSLHPCEF